MYSIMNSFSRLPNEILLEILNCLDKRSDLHSLCLVNKQCYNAADPVLWQREVSLDHPGPLHWAIDEGDASLVEKALSYGANPNRPAFSRPPRHKFNIPSSTGSSSRWWDYAPRLSSTQSLMSVHSHSRSFDSQDSAWADFGRSCWRPLHLAVSKGRIDLVEMLLDRGASINELSWRLCECQPHPSPELFPEFTAEDDGWGLGFIDIKDGGWTPLHVAICHKNVDIAKLLLRRGASIEVHKDTRWHHGPHGEERVAKNITAMHDAARNDLTELMTFLVDEGYQTVDVDADLVGTPMHLAIWNGLYDSAVPWLLSRGANLDERCRETGCSPMLSMCIKQKFDQVAKLIHLGADVNSRAGPNPPFTALHLLCNPPNDTPKEVNETPYATKSEIAKLLISKGLSVDTPEDASGFTPLMIASGYCDMEMMRTLLEEGADPNLRDHGSATAFNKVGVLTTSTRPPIYEAGRLLIDSNLHIVGTAPEGQATPLNSVCLSHSRTSHNDFRGKQLFKLAKVILSRGADANDKGRFSSGPVAQAVFSGAFDIATAILEHGGRPDPSDFEMLMTPMSMRPTYQPGLISFILGVDFDRYGLTRPSNEYLDNLIKTSFMQGSWQATAELVEHHGISALPATALHRMFERSDLDYSLTKDEAEPLARALLEKGADPNLTWKGEPAIYFVGRGIRHLKCIKDVVAAGADLDKPTHKMPQGALLYFLKKRAYWSLNHILDYDETIFKTRSIDFHLKCWEHLLRPSFDGNTLDDGTVIVEALESDEPDVEGNEETSTLSDSDAEAEYYDLTPIAWEPILQYINAGLRTDAGQLRLENGITLQKAVEKVLPRCSKMDFDFRDKIIEHVGLSVEDLGLPTSRDVYDLFGDTGTLNRIWE